MALYNLPEDFKTALLLVFVEDLPYQEAAMILGAPIGTVRSRIFRGRALLRHALENSEDAPRCASLRG